MVSNCQSNCASQSVELQGTTYRGWGFTLTLPNDCKVKKGGIHDFDTYNFTKGDINILFIYAGFHPSFPKYVPNAVQQKSRYVHGKKVTGATWHDGELYSAEYLIQLRSEKEMFTGNSLTPGYLHCIYDLQNSENASLADAMMNSIHIVNWEP